MSRKTAILITGMHRSGTSALTRLVSLLGARLPDALVPANAGNPLGHWEPQAVVEMNDRMLADAASNVYAIADFNSGWFQSARAAAFTTEAAALIEAAYGGDPFIVVKDPRTALCLPIWEDALATCGYETVHLLPMRPPEEVARSLAARHSKDFAYDAWPSPRGELVWLRYTLAALRGTRRRPRAIVLHRKLMSDWRATVQEINDRTGLSWPRLGMADVERDIDAFLQPEAIHSRAFVPIVCDRPLAELTLTELAGVLFDIAVQAGDDTARVDFIQEEFARRTGSVRQLLSAYESTYPLIWQYHEEVQRRGQTIDAFQRTSSGQRHAVQNLWGLLSKQSTDQGVLRQSLNAAVEHAQSLETALQAQSDRLHAQIVQDQEICHAEKVRLQAAIDQLNQRLYDESNACHAEKVRLQSEGDQLSLRLARELGAMQDKQEQLKTSSERIDELERERQLIAEQLETARMQHEQLQVHGIAVEAKFIALEAQFNAIDAEVKALRTHASALEAVLAKVKASWSWKVTGPFRLIRRKLMGSA